MQAALAHVTPSEAVAELHRKKAEPLTEEKSLNGAERDSPNNELC